MGSFFISLLLGAFYSFVSIIDHRNGNSGLYDLGIFEQILYQLSQGQGFYSSVIGQNIFADHVSLILLILTPLYAVFPHAETLLLVQSLALASGFGLTAWVARILGLSNREPVIWGIFFAAFPTVFYLVFWDFHPLVLALPLLFAALAFERKGRWKGALILYLSTLLFREEMGLVIFGVGLGWFFFKKQRLWGSLLTLVGVSFFLFSVLYLMPGLGTGKLAHLERYQHLGNSLPEMIRTLFLHPVQSFIGSTTPRKILTLAVCFAPFLGLSILGWRTLVPVIIPFAYNYLSAVPNQFDFRAHYLSVAIPFIVVAAMEGRVRLVRRLGPRRISSKGLLWALGVTAFICQGLYFYIPPISARNDLVFPVATSPSASLQRLDEAMSLIDSSTPLVVSNALGSHVAKRPQLFLFGRSGHLLKDEKTALLVDLSASDPWPFDNRGAYVEQARRWVMSGRHRVAYFQDGLLLLVPGDDASGRDDVLRFIDETGKNHLK